MTSYRILAFAGIVSLTLAGCQREPTSDTTNDSSLSDNVDIDESSIIEHGSKVDVGAIAEEALSETSSAIKADLNSSGGR